VSPLQREDRILQGALDLHAHGYPEFTLRMAPRVDNVEWARLALAAGMRGFVIKSHIFPTTTAAHMLRSEFPELEVFGSITLNPTVGGINPVSVEIAAQSGAKVVWMPTWSALQNPPHPSIYRERMALHLETLRTDTSSVPDVGIFDDKGALSSSTLRVIELCARYDVTIATGHVPIAASLILAAAARELGARVILTHPLSGSVGASIEQQQAFVSLGGFIEHVFIGCMPMHQRMEPQRIVDAIEAVGPEHVVLSSDAIEAWNPPEPEVMRMFIATLLALGVDEDAVHLMTHDNPARALGLEGISPSSSPSE
jgi:hypothetical protein